MSDPHAFWDGKYAGEGFFYGTRPNAWLASQTGYLRPGLRVLVPGDGEGRNGVWLANQGLHVLSVDASAKGLAKAEALARQHGVDLTTEVVDLRTWDWPRDVFDLAVLTYVHFHPDERVAFHRNVLGALRPGGTVLLEAFSPYQHIYRTGGSPHLDMLYTAWGLCQDFADAEIVLAEETLTELDEGTGHSGTAAVTRLIARRQ